MAGNIFRISKVTNEQTINTNRFSIRFIGLKDLLLIKAPASPLPGVKKRYQMVKNAIGTDPATQLEISLVSASFPAVSLEVDNIPRFNDFVKAVKKFEAIEELTVNFMDYVNGSASAILLLWHAFVGDKETGAIGFKQDFVLPRAEFYVYGPDAPGYSDEYCDDNNGPPYLQKYEIVNLFPRAIKFPEHSADASDPRKIEATFVCDNIYPIEIYTYDYYATNPENRYVNAAVDIASTQS